LEQFTFINLYQKGIGAEDKISIKENKLIFLRGFLVFFVILFIIVLIILHYKKMV